MAIELGPHRYGKSRVRVVKVHDDGGITDLTIALVCEGDFAAVHTAGDCTPLIATDTMRNTIYALAQERLGREPERFGRVLAAHFLEYPQVGGVEVQLDEQRWLPIGGSRHAHTPAPDRRVAQVKAGSCGDGIGAGIRGMIVLKTAGSAFSGFHRDRYTTLADTEDRILATEVTADWTYARHPDDYTRTWESVRTTLMEDFAERPSRSVQEQGWMMGRSVLEQHPEIGEIRLRLPNKHHLPFDLSRFEMEDRGVVFHPVDEPFGDIEVTVQRTAETRV